MLIFFPFYRIFLSVALVPRVVLSLEFILEFNCMSEDVSPLCACFTPFYCKDRQAVTKFCLKTTRNVQYDEKRRFKSKLKLANLIAKHTAYSVALLC